MEILYLDYIMSNVYIFISIFMISTTKINIIYNGIKFEILYFLFINICIFYSQIKILLMNYTYNEIIFSYTKIFFEKQVC